MFKRADRSSPADSALYLRDKGIPSGEANSLIDVGARRRQLAARRLRRTLASIDGAVAVAAVDKPQRAALPTYFPRIMAL